MAKDKVFAPFKMPDYRVIRPSIFLEKGGNTVAAIQQISSFHIGKCKIEFITPNPITLFFNKSWKEYEQALEIYKTTIKPNLNEEKSFVVNDTQLSALYDYLELIQSSIIAIYSAVEALSNAAIPSDYTLKRKNNKGIEETWTKENIERWDQTTEKIGKIVPEILSFESPKSQSFWEGFMGLKELRDDIIHQKQSKKDPNNIEQSHLYLLLSESVFTKILSGFALIKYCCEKNQTHTYFPMLNDEIPVDVNMVDSFDGIFEWTTNSPIQTFVNSNKSG
ncbi:MAG: hypothetical protein Q8K66_13520 [Sediminibacterium sp.]|nr:hypothetical protein [Sediminibacterium sp.]MDP3129206.1 hypothetical protein [Sediminibacterium sp.]